MKYDGGSCAWQNDNGAKASEGKMKESLGNSVVELVCDMTNRLLMLGDTECESCETGWIDQLC